MAKKKGRPRKSLSAAEYAHRRRHGTVASASVTRQLEWIVRMEGSLSRSAFLSARSLVSLCTAPHPRAVSLKEKGAEAFAILGTAGEPIARRLAKMITGREIFAPDAEASPWVLHTRGKCKPHLDHIDARVFTLVICVRTDLPYEMRISCNKQYAPTRYRHVTMTSGSFIVFPSNVAHECAGKETNKRTIVTLLVR